MKLAAPPKPVKIGLAGAAASHPSLKVSVLWLILVTALAVGFSGIQGCWGDGRPSHVDHVSNWLQMGGIHAGAIAAGVVKLAISRYRPSGQLVGESVSPNDFAISEVELAVPVGVQASSPVPAWARRNDFNISPKSLFWRSMLPHLEVS